MVTLPAGFVELVESTTRIRPSRSDRAERRGGDASTGVPTDRAGCTHYPFLIPSGAVVAGRDVSIVDPSPAVARRVVQLLDVVVQLLDEGGLRAAPGRKPSYVFCTFADEAYRRRLELKAFGAE